MKDILKRKKNSLIVIFLPEQIHNSVAGPTADHRVLGRVNRFLYSFYTVGGWLYLLVLLRYSR